MGGYKRVCLSFLMSFTRREPHLYSPVARLCELPQPPCLPPRACSLPAPTPTPVRSTRARTFCGHVPKRLAQRPTSAEHHSVWEGRQWPPGLVAVRFQTPVQTTVCQNICARAHPAAPTAQSTSPPTCPREDLCFAHEPHTNTPPSFGCHLLSLDSMPKKRVYDEHRRDPHDGTQLRNVLTPNGKTSVGVQSFVATPGGEH